MRFRRALLPLAALALFAGCDTNNSGGFVNDLAGTYAFTELRFVPSASAIDPANVLARLDTALTDVEVDSEGRAFFFLRESGTTLIAETFVTATSSSATFRARTATDIERLVRYLLPSVLRVDHDGGVNALNGSPSLRVNLQAFDPQAYQGLTDVPGTLFVRLERR
jgi:hypothetical protein